ncbi:organic cation transporter protein-like [Tropilaelaps mercedesae]|uniref:Organic cation transporter protein-like n=1 Tax=Tropilaelaps mercedesae TaxID=418985 RepID=A0A1V9XG07_9ACAR|nr:organic cation transporter protein-like [Tropilaelaps mercedesae]
MLVNLVDKEMLRFEDKFVTPSWPPTPEQEGGHPYTVMLDPSYSTGTASTVDSGSIYSDSYGRSLIRRPYSRMNTLQNKGTGDRGLNPRPDPVEWLGTFGKWHFLILVYAIILGLVIAFQDTIGLDFLAPRNIAYQCDYFGNGSAVSSVQTRSNLLDSIRLRDEERRLVERCFVRDFDVRNGSELLPNVEPSTSSATNMSEVLVVDPNSSKPCRKWVFPQDVHKRTMVEEWELVCDASWLSLFPRGAHLAGLLCGALFWALLADRWGRVPSIALANVLHVAASVAAAFTPSWKYFALAKAGSSFGLGGMLIAFVLQLETLVAHMRCWVVAGLFLSWSLGLVGLPAAALWLSPNWRYLQLAITAFSIVLLPLLMFFRESPRWLLTSGRHERAERGINAIASINGKIFSEIDAMQLRQSYLDHDGMYGGSVTNFRRGSGGSKRRSMFEPNTIADPYGYMAHPRDNLFWGYVIWSVTEITAAVFAMYALRFWSRKWTAVFCYLLLAAVYAGIVLVPRYLGDNVWYAAGLAMGGRFVASATLAIVSIYCDEVFPTTVRALGSASKHVFFRLALLAEPLFRDLVPTKDLPEAGAIVNGTLCLVSILLLIILPETYNKPLPDTAHDVSALSTRCVFNGQDVLYRLRDSHSCASSSISLLQTSSAPSRVRVILTHIHLLHFLCFSTSVIFIFYSCLMSCLLPPAPPRRSTPFRAVDISGPFLLFDLSALCPSIVASWIALDCVLVGSDCDSESFRNVFHFINFDSAIWTARSLSALAFARTWRSVHIDIAFSCNLIGFRWASVSPRAMRNATMRNVRETQMMTGARGSGGGASSSRARYYADYIDERASEQSQSETLKKVTTGGANNTSGSNNNNNATSGSSKGRKSARRSGNGAADARKPRLLEKGTMATSFTYDNLDFTNTKF